MGAGIALALVVSLVSVLPAEAADPVTAFTLDSEVGDWVGWGQTLVFTPANATITAAGDASLFEISTSNADHSFGAHIAPPTGQQLAPGTYETARFADATPDQIVR
jgi:hypothetical protein